ncbi:MAG: gluconolactonase [Rhodospirillaceae bacterium]|jgi:sugar lactone lactonase YvrE|nr:gluconolactonase [Rhodospirillaceae bacterium]MBT4487854.1 gluconolactonase [Rhodospirillaceae bacterium]MBT5193965.1 gluconolactonase [Rhodospirillaceae bacterium]MBT6431163.1 gluconolactonase [Rhodospirillaceae bacterium]MBT7757581.1 gluconolactonase [Rhodospirillaceae bacterium]
MTERPSVLLEDLTFPEGPRWHDGRLWFSDFYAHEVVAVDLTGKRETIVKVPGQPSGLGWTPDGRLLVVSMTDRRLLRLDPDGLQEVADLSDLAAFHCNDMVVDGEGGAYVGNFGFNSHGGDPYKAADLIRVDPDGRTSVAATGLAFPNGAVITPDGGTLIVGETRGNILSAWDRAANGALSNRRVWADLGGGFPDGICLDAEGAVWVADPRNKETIRVLEGGEVTDRISTGDYGSFACMLGGPDRRTLFICTCLQSGPGTAELRSGRIETIDVDIPGAGWP